MFNSGLTLRHESPRKSALPPSNVTPKPPVGADFENGHCAMEPEAVLCVCRKPCWQEGVFRHLVDDGLRWSAVTEKAQAPLKQASKVLVEADVGKPKIPKAFRMLYSCQWALA